MWLVRYRVLDVIVEIAAERERWLGEVKKSLARFPTAGENVAASLTIRAGGEAIEAFDTRGAGLMRRPLQAGDPLPWLLKTVTNQCLLATLAETHDILHGSAVAAHERAYLFIGGSGSGKTTLILALRRRGYHLLCEGQIPVSRTTSLVQPFPRGVEEKATGAFPPSSFKKTAPLRGKTHSLPCRATGVFFLEDIYPGMAAQAFLVACPPRDEAALRRTLSDLPVREVWSEAEAGLCLVRFVFQPTATLGLNDLYQRLIESGARVDFIRSAKQAAPQWDKPVVLEEISLPQAALGLAANCFRLARNETARGENNVLGVFSRVVKDARGYLLRHGGVEERVRCVMEKIGPPRRVEHV